MPLGVSPPKSSNCSTTFSGSIQDSQPGTSKNSSNTILQTANGSTLSTPLGTPSGSTIYSSTPENSKMPESEVSVFNQLFRVVFMYF